MALPSASRSFSAKRRCSFGSLRRSSMRAGSARSPSSTSWRSTSERRSSPYVPKSAASSRTAGVVPILESSRESPRIEARSRQASRSGEGDAMTMPHQSSAARKPPSGKRPAISSRSTERGFTISASRVAMAVRSALLPSSKRRVAIAGSMAGVARSTEETAVCRVNASLETSRSSQAVSSRAAKAPASSSGPAEASAPETAAPEATTEGGASARPRRSGRRTAQATIATGIAPREPPGVRPLLGDPKIRVITRKTAPAHVDRIDAGGPWPAVGPADEILDLVFIAFGEKLHSPVCSVFDPAGKPQTARFTLCGRAKKDALDPSTNEELYLLQRHFGFFLAKSRSRGNFARKVGRRGTALG